MDGRKDDMGKSRFDLLPVSAVEQIVKVLNFGAQRYADDNWQKVPNLEARYYAALQRHLTAWRQGELVDEDSGLPHLAHAGCCLLFLLSKQVGFDRSLADDLDELDADEPIPLVPTGVQKVTSGTFECTLDPKVPRIWPAGKP